MTSTFNFNGDINFTGNLYKNNSPYLDYYSTQYFLRVSANGNDSLAPTAPYQIPFQTINAAINYVNLHPSQRNTIFLYPGIYNESIIVPSGVAIRGASTQTTIIEQTVESSTTLVTLSSNCRIEDVTMNLNSVIDGIELIGIKVQDTACITSKIRTCVLNVTHAGVGSTDVYGIYSTGTCNTGVSSSNLVRAATINTTSTGVGKVRGVLVGGSVRVTTRDTNIFCNGGGGCEVVNVNGYLDLRTSTISGTTFDISQTTGSILLGSTDLVHSKANDKSFTVSISPTQLLFGLVGNMSNTTYYLVPGVAPIASLPSSSSIVPVVRNTLFFKLNVTFSGTITSPDTVVFELYKNNALTPFTVTLTSTQLSTSIELISLLFEPGDTYYSRIISNGNPGDGTLVATFLIY